MASVSVDINWLADDESLLLQLLKLTVVVSVVHSCSSGAAAGHEPIHIGSIVGLL